MNSQKEHIKVLTTLSLSASDTRDDTLVSVVLNTLFECGPCDKSKLCKEIDHMYDFSPYEEEIGLLLNKLEEQGSIAKNKSKEYIITESEKIKLEQAELNLRDQDKIRYQNFKGFILEEVNPRLASTQIRQIWDAFIEYLYNNFFEYGIEAINKFHPFKEDTTTDKEANERFFSTARKALKDAELFNAFRKAVAKFPDYASQQDIEFLNSLAQKTLSFSSLGVNPKLVESFNPGEIIDWVVYLDTNVIFSLLDLHYNRENDASKGLVDIIKENKQNVIIKLRYSELTRRELRGKKAEFDLLDDKMPDSTIRALLKSDQLDDFATQFYKNLLHNREGTLHPSKVIELSPEVLMQGEIQVSQHLKRLDQIGHEYLDIQIQEYRRFIEEKNQNRQEFCKHKGIEFKEIYRSDSQIRHDITLRELVLHHRNSSNSKSGELPTMKSVKYYAITQDQLLLEFDKMQMRDVDDARKFPVFFKPSFLLNKLVKVLPIKTKDYKKAFIKAVTARGYNVDITKSRDVLRVANYMKSKGIDNTDVLYNLISEDVFLEKFAKESQNADFDKDEFFESEINREFKEREKELEKTKKSLSQKSRESEANEAQNKVLASRKDELEELLKQYESATKKLSKDIKKVQKSAYKNSLQPQMNFEAEEEKREKEKYKRELKDEIDKKIKTYKTQELRRWQKRIWLNLIWAIPLMIFCLWIVLLPDSFAEWINLDKIAVRTILSLLSTGIIGLFYLLYTLRYGEKNVASRLDRISIPDELERKRKNLE